MSDMDPKWWADKLERSLRADERFAGIDVAQTNVDQRPRVDLIVPGDRRILFRFGFRQKVIHYIIFTPRPIDNPEPVALIEQLVEDHLKSSGWDLDTQRGQTGQTSWRGARNNRLIVPYGEPDSTISEAIDGALDAINTTLVFFGSNPLGPEAADQSRSADSASLTARPSSWEAQFAEAREAIPFDPDLESIEAGIERQREATRLHFEIQLEYEAHLKACGFSVTSGYERDEPRWDIKAFRDERTTMVEVKTVELHEAHQMRLGIGQLLDYRHGMSALNLPVDQLELVVSRNTESFDRWYEVCDCHDIRLIAPTDTENGRIWPNR